MYQDPDVAIVEGALPMAIPRPESEIAALPPAEGSSDSRGWAVGAHLSPWVAGFLGPLFIWLAKKDDPFVEYHARGALNYQLSLLLYVMVYFLAMVTIVVLLAVGGAAVIGVVIMGLGFLAFIYLGFVPPIMGAIRASNGEIYRYPVSIQFIKAPAV
jgi:uncharacterized Tic20 family protein